MSELLRRASRRTVSRLGLIAYRHPAISRQRQTAVGFDVGAGQIKMVQIRPTRTGPRLENFAILPMPPGLIREGTVTQPADLGTLLQQLVSEMNLGQLQVGSTLGGPAVMVRQVSLPAALPADELAAAMRFEAPQQLPVPPAELIYDYTPYSSEGEQQTIFLAGTHRSVVESISHSFAGARLRLQAVELDTLAFWRALDVLGLRPLDPHEPVALLDMGEQATRLTIYQETLPTFTRSIPTGLMSLRLALGDAQEITRDQAEAALRAGPLLTGELATVVGPWLRSLLEAVSRALEFFLIQHRGLAVRRFFVAGGGAVLPGVVEHMARELADAMYDRQPGSERLRVEPVGLESLAVNPAAVPALAGVGPLLIHALGSALRGEAEV